ncbi:unnamed protein product [Absidia cylindrospora]
MVRVSIIGRNMHNKSASTKTVEDMGTNVETIDEDGDDDDNKVDQAATINDKQTPLTPTKRHNSTNVSASLSKTKTAQYGQQPPPDTKVSEVLQSNTEDNTEEKENTPVTLNRDTSDTSHMDDSSGASNTIRVTPLEDSEKLPTSK